MGGEQIVVSGRDCPEARCNKFNSGMADVND
jgi:hypothetical protein